MKKSLVLMAAVVMTITLMLGDSAAQARSSWYVGLNFGGPAWGPPPPVYYRYRPPVRVYAAPYVGYYAPAPLPPPPPPYYPYYYGAPAFGGVTVGFYGR